MLETLGAPGPPRRRRRPRNAEPADPPASLPLTRVTAIRAAAPFDSVAEAARWLDEATEADDTVDTLIADAVGLLNRALHARAVAAGDPRSERSVSLERTAAARIGFGSGEETAAGRFAEAREIDVHGRGGSRRRQREEELRQQSRLAALLGGREGLDVCETMLLRARVDLDAGRCREAALQLRAGVQSMLAELRGGIGDDAGHDKDMAELEERSDAVEEAATTAIGGGLSGQQREAVAVALGLAERILRRRRVLAS